MEQSRLLTEEALSLAPLLVLYSIHHSLAKRGRHRTIPMARRSPAGSRLKAGKGERALPSVRAMSSQAKAEPCWTRRYDAMGFLRLALPRGLEPLFSP
jgi:hypothetical protein